MTMRLAASVLLHDCQTQLGSFELLWHEWQHKAGDMRFAPGWYTRVRALLGDNEFSAFFDEDGQPTSSWAHHKFPGRDQPAIEFGYSYADPWKDAAVWCDVLGPNMLEIELIEKASDGQENRNRFTYCGTFSIWWATDDDGEYICK